MEQFIAKSAKGDNKGILDQVNIKSFSPEMIWSSYSSDSDPTAISLDFMRRHEYPPQYVIRSQDTILAGPVLDNKRTHRS